MKRKGNKNLTWTQRLQLEAWMNAGLHKKEIAARLGCCLATVYNELKRGQCEQKKCYYTDWFGDRRYRTVKVYSPQVAQDTTDINGTARGPSLKIGKDFEFVEYVERRVLQDKLSPCAVLGEIKRKHLFKTDISKTTLYRYIETGIFAHLSLKDCPMGARRKRYRKTVAKRAPKGVSIEKRPADIALRKEFGHWEMDCVCGPTLPTLLVLSERMTRREIIIPMKNQKSESVIKSLDVLERRYGELFRKVFKSITMDNGSEFSDFAGIEKSIFGGKRTVTYYCHPYCSCERGTNERLNREIRRKLPKGTDFSKYSASQIQAVEDWVNDYPRGVLGFATSREQFEIELSKI